MARGDLAGAEALLVRGLAIEESALGPDHPGVGATLGRLAAVRIGLDRFDEAEADARRSLAILDEAGDAMRIGSVESRLRLADLLRGRGRPDDSAQFCREAIDRIDAHPASIPAPLRIVALTWFAFALRDAGRLDEAEAAARRLLDATEAEPDARGLALNSLARIVAERGRLDEAEELCRLELEFHLGAPEPDPDRIDGALGNLDGLNSALGRLRDARDFASRRAENLARAKGPDHVDLVPILLRQADLAVSAAQDIPDPFAAERCLDRALAIAESSHGAGSRPVADLRLRRGSFFLARGWHHEALKEFRAALRIRRARRADDPVAHAMTLLAVSRAHADAGQALRAWWFGRSALSAIGRDRGPDHPDTATILEAIARYQAGRSLPKRAAPLLRSGAPGDPRATRWIRRARVDRIDAPCLSVAPVDQASGQLDRAAATDGRVDGSLSARLGPEHPEVGPVALALATTLRHGKRPSSAESPYRRALAIFIAADGPDTPRPAAVAFSLGTLLDDLGRPGEAEPLLRRTVDALHAIHGGDHPEAAPALSHLAVILRKLRRRDEADALDRRARAAGSRG